MPPVQPGASVAATGLGIRYVGDYAYAFSGQVAIINSETDLLNFHTSSGIIVGHFDFQSNDNTAEDIRFIVKMNGEIIYQIHNPNSPAGALWQVPINIIIPPSSNVILSAQFLNNVTYNCTAVITGRVYGAE